MSTAAPRVFVNCPYDDSFRPQFNAIVFTCVCAGLDPVIAGSSGRTGQPRLERILAELIACRYSVHDLSRCRGEGDDNLARFNMPLELGMAMAIRGAPAAAGAHEYLVLVPDGAHLHRRYISDLGGLDPQTHDGSPERIVTEVLAWLLTAAEAPAKIDTHEVIAKRPRFYDAVADHRRAWRGGTHPWDRVVEAAAHVARSV